MEREPVTMSRYLLTSESAIKRRVVEQLFQKYVSGGYELVCKNIPSSQIPDNVEQPVGIGGLVCCKNRVIAALKDVDVVNEYDGIISIENGIDSDPKQGFWDEVHVLVYDCRTRIYYYEHGCPVYYQQMYHELAEQKSDNRSALGWSYTVGEIMRDCQVIKNEKNWIAEIGCLRTNRIVDRHDQIGNVLLTVWGRYLMEEIIPQDIEANIGYDLKFKKGVVFQDLGPVMRNRTLFDMFMQQSMIALAEHQINRIDYVMGIGARGFYIGPGLAERLGGGFVPIRKKDKLPGDTVCIDYSTEYSTDIMEIQIDTFTSSRGVQRTVLVVDDLVATGGSLVAACQLIQQFQNIKIVGCFCPLKVKSLVGSARYKLSAQCNTELITL